MPLADVLLSVTTKGFEFGNMIIQRKKHATWNRNKPVVDVCFDQNLEKLENVKQRFLLKLHSWKRIRKKTIYKLEMIASECDSLHKGCNIANVTGSSVGAAGGIMALVGIALAPFTFGASLALTIAGGVTGIAGGITNTTTSIVESSKMKDLCKTVKNCLDTDRRETDAINAIVELPMGCLKSLKDQLKKISKLETMSIALNSTCLVTSTLSSAVGIGKTIQALKIVKSFSAEMSVLRECPKMLKGLQAFKGSAMAAGKLTTVIAAGAAAAVGLGASVYEIATTSHDIHNGSKTEAAKVFRQNAKNLEEQMNALCEIEAQLMYY